LLPGTARPGYRVKDGELYVWPSTQNVSRYSDPAWAMRSAIAQNKFMSSASIGGGFGSKFNSIPGEASERCSPNKLAGLSNSCSIAIWS